MKRLQELNIKDGNINIYTTFKKLLKLTGYSKAKQGTLKMFKAGLSGGLNIHIIINSATISDTLKGWIEAICQ